MGEFESLLLLYRDDPLMQKVKEIHDKWRNHNNHKKIVKQERDIYLLNLDDKFIKFPNILFECLMIMNFSTSECFKLYQVIYKRIQRSRTPYFSCKKAYLERQSRINHMTLWRSIKELQDKNILLVEKTNDYGFKFILNVAPLTWVLSEHEREGIKEEVEREVNRLHEKWIDENSF